MIDGIVLQFKITLSLIVLTGLSTHPFYVYYRDSGKLAAFPGKDLLPSVCTEFDLILC